MSIIFIQASHRNPANESMRGHADFDQFGGATKSFGESRGCRPVGSQAPILTWYVLEWGNLTGGRLAEWERVQDASGAPSARRVVFEGLTMDEALDEMDPSLELIVED